MSLTDDQRQTYNHHKTIRDVFKTFVSVRKDEFKPQLYRMLPPELDPQVVEFADTFSVQTPGTEHALDIIKKVLTLDGPRVDVTAQKEGTRAEDTAEEARIWFAAQLLRMNQGGWMQDACHEDTCTLGVSVFRLIARCPQEPEEGPEQERGEDVVAYAERYAKDRDEKVGKQGREAFDVVHVNPLTVSWGPDLAEPEMVCEESELTYYEARQLRQRSTEKMVTAIKGKGIYLAKEGEDVEGEPTSTEEMAEKRVKFTRWNYRDKKQGCWHVVEMVSSTEGTNSNAADEEILDEYDAPCCDYLIVPGGNEKQTERDPHLRYRGRLLPLIVLDHEHNFWNTIHGARAIKSLIRDVYVKLPPQIAGDQALMTQARDMLGQLGFIETGADGPPIFKVPDYAAGEVPALFELAPFPQELNSYVEARLAMIEQERQKYEPNRFSIGRANEEAKEATGSAFLAQMQAAAIEDDKDLKKINAFLWEPLLQRMRDWILYWDEGVSGDALKQYPITTSGEEPVRKGQVDPGKEIVITADKMRLNMTIRVTTRNETLQEQQVNHQMAYADYDRGTIDLTQLLERLGFEDPNRQVRKLNEFRHRLKAAQQFQAAEDQERSLRFQALTGINANFLQASQPMPAGGGQTSNPQRIPGPTTTLGVPVLQGAGSGGGMQV